jgi:hypothetical protein
VSLSRACDATGAELPLKKDEADAVLLYIARVSLMRGRWLEEKRRERIDRAAAGGERVD